MYIRCLHVEKIRSKLDCGEFCGAAWLKIRNPRFLKDHDSDKGKSPESLRAAFKHEVRPEEYLFRVWLTALIVGVYFAYTTATQNSQFQLAILIPFDGWHAHDPTGALYIETWGNILVNSLQFGFGIWGAVLIFLGCYRAFTSHKYVFACFYLGIAFLGFVLVLPNWTEVLLRMLAEKCPVLVQQY